MTGSVIGGDDFWIASSRKCRQTAPHGCSCGDLEFFRVIAGQAPQLLNRGAFYGSLVPGVPVCVVVHGSFVNWKGLCDECAPVFRWIRGAGACRPLHVIFYSWPSAGPITYEPHLDVAILGSRASFNSVYLADLIAQIPPGHPVCLIGHSHGARMTVAALHLLGGGAVDNAHLNVLPPSDQRLRAVLIAGALDHNWMNPGERFGLALCRAECLLYMRNDHDIALSFYPARRFFSRRALGESGLRPGDLRQLGPLSTKVVQMDVTRVVHAGHLWNHYYRRPELGAAIAPYIYFEDGNPTAVPDRAILPPAPASQLAPSNLPAIAGPANDPSNS